MAKYRRFEELVNGAYEQFKDLVRISVEKGNQNIIGRAFGIAAKTAHQDRERAERSKSQREKFTDFLYEFCRIIMGLDERSFDHPSTLEREAQDANLALSLHNTQDYFKTPGRGQKIDLENTYQLYAYSFSGFQDAGEKISDVVLACPSKTKLRKAIASRLVSDYKSGK